MKNITSFHALEIHSNPYARCAEWFVMLRDGRKTQFDHAKIINALIKAGASTGEFDQAVAEDISLQVVSALGSYGEHSFGLEFIQDTVEEILLRSPYKKTAKAYILYREKRAFMRKLTAHNKSDLIDTYLNKKDWKVKENSNTTYSLQGLNNYIVSDISQMYWLDKVYPVEIKECHTSGDFHIHDLCTVSVYCVGWDLRDLLNVGFCGVAGKVSSSPAKHLRSALGQMVNFFYTLQGEAAGAQAFSSVDTLLAPFIRYDNLDYNAVKQAVQEFIFNVNVPTRVGFQSPFTNLTLDLCPPKHLKDEHVVIGGKMQKEVYGDFQKEMDMFNRAFCEVLAEGDANQRVFSFPIPTYNITKDFDWDKPELKQLWEITAKYGIPYFANYVNSDVSPDDVRSMCCRLRLDHREIKKYRGGIFAANPLTGSIGVVTINLPRIGLLAHDKPDFLSRLSRLMDLAKTSLEIKRKTLERLTDENLYPFSKFYLRDIKRRTGQYWCNHFATIGLVGMNEACVHVIGKDIGTEEGRAFACEVLDFMNKKANQYQEETNSFYNIEATPAESTSYRFYKLDKERFPEKLDRYDSQYGGKIYTNSSCLPVNYSDDAFKVLDLQDQIQTRYTGGTVLHVFLGEAKADPNAVKRFVKKVCTKYKLPQITVTPTFSICSEHGYIVGKQETCSKCGKETEVYSRVVGYLRPVNQWNEGKQAEFYSRVVFDI